ncbi:MAG: hypothetical protein ACYC1A_00065 [Spirochaetales bacterium]
MGFTMISFRGLELHGKSIWNHRSIERALETANRYGLNALVLHESDFTTESLYPKPLFDPDATWEGAPARRGENALQNNQAYMRDILARAKRAGVEVWIENIEITFPDELLEKMPELMIEGKVCPTHPYWAEFLHAKYLDLASTYPGIRGLIVSAGSPEGRASLSQKKCGCARCATTPLASWYEFLLSAIHEALSRKGLLMAVREFSYTADHQAAIAEAMAKLPGDLISCMKNTPHDFYPTFPDNPLIAQKTENPKWIEYDTMGQFYGWGAFPCMMRADIERRITSARGNGVDGVLLRVEWERVNDWWSLDTPNRMNLHAAAVAARGLRTTDAELFRDWLEEESIDIAPASEAIAMAFLADTWDIMRKALYIHDFVFNDSSRFPLTIRRAWWSMRSKHSLGEWFPERRADMDLDAGKLESYLGEKAEALASLDAWIGKLGAIDADDAKKLPFIAGILDFRAYILGWQLTGTLCLLAEAITREAMLAERAAIRERLKAAIVEARAYTASPRKATIMSCSPIPPGSSGWPMNAKVSYSRSSGLLLVEPSSPLK